MQRINFKGQDVSQLDDQALSHVRQQQIGFIFQSFHLVPRLTAEGNVALPMVFAGIPSSERQIRAKEALEAVGLVGSCASSAQSTVGWATSNEW